MFTVYPYIDVNATLKQIVQCNSKTNCTMQLEQIAQITLKQIVQLIMWEIRSLCRSRHVVHCTGPVHSIAFHTDSYSQCLGPTFGRVTLCSPSLLPHVVLDCKCGSDDPDYTDTIDCSVKNDADDDKKTFASTSQDQTSCVQGQLTSQTPRQPWNRREIF